MDGLQLVVVSEVSRRRVVILHKPAGKWATLGAIRPEDPTARAEALRHPAIVLGLHQEHYVAIDRAQGVLPE
eukprot:916980-Alexandrium_andersonii.AAC.1